MVRVQCLLDEFHSLFEPIDRVKHLLTYASTLPPFLEATWVPFNCVMGCTAQVWVVASLDDLSRMMFVVDFDSKITKGFCFCLISVLDRVLLDEVLEVKPEDFGDLNMVGLSARANSRVNTWHNMLISTQKRTKALIAKGEGRMLAEPFPSSVIGVDGVQTKGSYVEA